MFTCDLSRELEHRNEHLALAYHVVERVDHAAHLSLPVEQALVVTWVPPVPVLNLPMVPANEHLTDSDYDSSMPDLESDSDDHSSMPDLVESDSDDESDAEGTDHPDDEPNHLGHGGHHGDGGGGAGTGGYVYDAPDDDSADYCHDWVLEHAPAEYRGGRTAHGGRSRTAHGERSRTAHGDDFPSDDFPSGDFPSPSSSCKLSKLMPAGQESPSDRCGCWQCVKGREDDYDEREQGALLGECPVVQESCVEGTPADCAIASHQEAAFPLHSSGVETVEGNRALYSKKEVAAADRARDFSAAMAFPSTKVVLQIVRSGRADGLDFGVDDVLRAVEIYGPSLEFVRGKSTRMKRSALPQKATGATVGMDVTLHVDIAFLAGVPFLISLAKPMGVLASEWIKSRSISDIRKAILRQSSKLASEGFKVVEVRSDGEGAIQAIASELEQAGMRVTIHSPDTYSAEIDNKIKQIKGCVRAITVLPYLLPLALIMYAVFFAISKINMLPSSINAHDYSPTEMFVGRGISVARDLGGRRGGKPLAFGSRCEVYAGTTNTMADRTRPSIFLGAKGNSFGSSLFFLLDTGKVVSRDQWKHLPLDAGTCHRMNEWANKRGAVPNRIQVHWKGADLPDSAEEIARSAPLARRHVVAESTEELQHYPEDSTADDVPGVNRADEESVIESVPSGQQLELEETPEPGEPPANGLSPSEPISAAPVEPRWHNPTQTDEQRAAVEPRGGADLPWFLSGGPVEPTEGRPSRECRAPDRYGFHALWAVDGAPQTRAVTEHLPVVKGSTRTPATRSRQSPGSLACALRRRTRESLSSKFKLRTTQERAFVIRTSEGLKLFGQPATDAMIKELTSVHQKGVFSQVRMKDLSNTQLRSIIRSSLFFKEKFLSTGAFEKLKARLVAGGDLQDRALYSSDETSSPTVSLQSLYLVAALAAKEGRKVGTMDVGTAYLNADMKREVLMRIEPKLARVLVGIDPTLYALEENGSIIVRLDKALYGCIESAKLWYDNLSATLRRLGFKPNRKDTCVLNLIRDGHQVTVCIYVDDIFCTSKNQEDLDWLAVELRSKYGEVSVNLGEKHSYLGQTFDFSVEGEVKVSMEGYTREMLELYKVHGTRATPAAEGLFVCTEGLPPLSDAEADIFHSRVAKLLYLAQRARPDVLTPVAFLTTRVHKCTEEDWIKLERVLKYLNGTPMFGIRLRPLSELKVFVYVDASFAVHEDMKSHTGSVLTLGEGPICVGSKKQTLMTKSSTESELVGVSDVLTQVLWTRDFLIEQGMSVPPAVLYQDNTSTILLAVNGRSKSARTRHIAIRYFFVKDRIDSGEVVVEHMPTESMLADIMTKPLQGELFRRMRSWLLGMDA